MYGMCRLGSRCANPGIGPARTADNRHNSSSQSRVRENSRSAAAGSQSKQSGIEDMLATLPPGTTANNGRWDSV